MSGEDNKKILRELVRLNNKIEELKANLNNSYQNPDINDSNFLSSAGGMGLETESFLDLIRKQLDETTNIIMSEMKSEFYRLINFLVTSDTQSQEQFLKSMKDELSELSSLSKEQTEGKISSSKEKEYVNRLMEMVQERERLIYELSDQVITLSVEKTDLEKKYNQIKEEKENWKKTKNIASKLITTDPRYTIINMLKQLQTISQMQLSFVLGISLSQTKKYIKELEHINIVITNEDGSVQLNPDFNLSFL